MVNTDTRPIYEQGIDAVHKQLVEFGYPSLTREIVATAYQNWKDGKQPEGVIEMFAFKDFDEHTAIFGSPAA